MKTTSLHATARVYFLPQRRWGCRMSRVFEGSIVLTVHIHRTSFCFELRRGTARQMDSSDLDYP